MKIRLTPKQKAQLTAARARIQTTYSAVRKSRRAHDSDEAQAEELAARIDESESTVSASAVGALNSLATDRSLLEAIQRRQPQRHLAVGSAEAAHRAALDAARESVEEITKPLSSEVETRVARHLAVVLDEQEARPLVWLSRPGRALIELRSCRFRGIADPAFATQEALRTLDVLLSGNLPDIQLP